MHGHITEPIARRRGLVHGGAIIGDEFHDFGYIGLIPPPFHVPPAGLRLRRTAFDAFQFKQPAAERHLFLHSELGELLHAIDLRQAAHIVEEHIGFVGLGLDQRAREIGVVDRQHIAVIAAASFGQRLDEGLLQGVAISVIGRNEEPFLAEPLDQFRRYRIGFHRCRVANAEHIPFAICAGDRVGVATRHDVKDLLLIGHLRHCISNAGIHVAKDHTDVVAVDQFTRLLHASADVIGGIFDEKLNRTAEDPALFVDFGLGIFGAVHLALRQSREHAGKRIDHPNFDWFVAARGNDERRANDLTGAERKTRLDKRATAHRL